MRDLAMLAAFAVYLPLALANGYVAYLLWGWTAAFSPANYLYGFMVGVRYNLIFALVALASLFLNRKAQPGKFTFGRTTTLLTLLLAHGMVCALLGFSPSHINQELSTQFAKSVVFCLLMPFFVAGRLRIHAMLLMLGLGIGFHGLVDGAKFIASGGGHKVLGIPTSMMSDNNHFAVGLGMVLPILIYLYQYSENKLVRWGFLGCVALNISAIMGTNSRGGFLCLAAIGIWFFVTSRRKVVASLVVAAAVVAVVNFAPERWFQRIETIQDASEDLSFMARVNAWKVYSAIALDNPVFGGGFHAGQVSFVWSRYRQSEGLLGFVETVPREEGARAAHSIYFEIMGDLGFVGFGIFMLLMLNAFATRWEIASMARRAGPDWLWARDAADMLVLSVVAYAIGGAGVSLGYFETYYVVLMLLEVLKQHVRESAPLAAPRLSPSAAPAVPNVPNVPNITPGTGK